MRQRGTTALAIVAGILLFGISGDAQEPSRLGEPLHLPLPQEQTQKSGLAINRAEAQTWIDTSRRQAVTNFYNYVLLATENVPIEWTGDVVVGIPGTTSQAFRDAAATRVNWFRSMAGVPPLITFDPIKNAKAQQAALMMSANRDLSHFPPTSWTHYTAEGAEAASNSNICYSYGSLDPGCVSLYMQDSGSNNGAVGHRRWILYPQTQSMGTGDVPRTGTYPAANALWVFDSHMWEPRPDTRDGFVAWPPPGFVPSELFYSRWSFSYPGADFTGASVSLTRNGTPVSVTYEQVANGYGENTLVWVVGPGDLPLLPPASDVAYSVTVQNVTISGTPQEFSYTTTAYNARPEAFGPGLYHPASSLWFLRNQQAAGPADVAFSFGPGSLGWIPLVGDWDGDGVATPGLYAPSSGSWFLSNQQSAGAADAAFSYGPGAAGWIPLAGDWNGDGVDTPGLYNPATGQWFLRNTCGTGVADVTFSFGPGGLGWIPLKGDWNGDGIDTPGLYAPSTGFWFLRDTASSGPADVAFGYGPGGLGWTPMVGDWDGDGRQSPGLYDPGTGFWFLRNSNSAGPAETVFSFGPSQAGFVPLAGVW